MVACPQAQHEEQVASLEAQLDALQQSALAAEAQLMQRGEEAQQLQEQLDAARQQHQDLQAAEGEGALCRPAPRSRFAAHPSSPRITPCALCPAHVPLAAAGELQSCLAAASERIAQLEQDMEAANAAHEQQVAQLQEELATLKVRPCSSPVRSAP